jgi:hypothetical protein
MKTSNEISEMINDHFRGYNNSYDDDFYCDEYITDNLICINISVLNLRCANEIKEVLSELHKHFDNVCKFIFDNCDWINKITSPMGDKTRK